MPPIMKAWVKISHVAVRAISQKLTEVAKNTTAASAGIRNTSRASR